VGVLRTDYTSLHDVRHQKTGTYNTPFSPRYSIDYNYLNNKFSFVSVISNRNFAFGVKVYKKSNTGCDDKKQVLIYCTCDIVCNTLHV